MLEGKDFIKQEGNKSNKYRGTGGNKVTIDSQMMNGGEKEEINSI